MKLIISILDPKVSDFVRKLLELQTDSLIDLEIQYFRPWNFDLEHLSNIQRLTLRGPSCIVENFLCNNKLPRHELKEVNLILDTSHNVLNNNH